LNLCHGEPYTVENESVGFSMRYIPFREMTIQPKRSRQHE
jgi:hypothetical protein